MVHGIKGLDQVKTQNRSLPYFLLASSCLSWRLYNVTSQSRLREFIESHIGAVLVVLVLEGQGELHIQGFWQ